MDLGVILLLIALLVGVGLYLAAPLISHASRRGVHDTQEVSSLMAERDRVITALQELDFDFKLGKIPDEDYPVQRTELLQKGAGILKKLEVFDAVASPSETGNKRQNQRLAAQLQQPAEDPARELTDDKIEEMLAARRKARKTRSGGFCPRCGKPIMITDQFCPSCGKALA